MVDCEKGHHVRMRFYVVDDSGVIMADSAGEPREKIEAIITDMAAGDCPVCTGNLALEYYV